MNHARTKDDSIEDRTVTAKRILLINNEPYLRELLQDCLSQLGGWQVFSTGSPIEGLQHAIAEHPDAIVLDLTAFSMDYCTFLHRLREQAPTQSIPLVLITPGAKWLDFQSLQEFHIAGAIDTLLDPLKITQQIALLLHWERHNLPH